MGVNNFDIDWIKMITLLANVFHFFSPQGKRCTTFKQVNEYHERMEIGYDITQFSFSLKGIKDKVQDQLKVRCMIVLVQLKGFLHNGNLQ